MKGRLGAENGRLVSNSGDRETDIAERERKTALMQLANQADERSCRLSPFSLQLQTEQIDAQHLAGLSEARLLHHNQCCASSCRHCGKKCKPAPSRF